MADFIKWGFVGEGKDNPITLKISNGQYVWANKAGDVLQVPFTSTVKEVPYQEKAFGLIVFSIASVNGMSTEQARAFVEAVAASFESLEPETTRVHGYDEKQEPAIFKNMREYETGETEEETVVEDTTEETPDTLDYTSLVEVEEPRIDYPTDPLESTVSFGKEMEVSAPVEEVSAPVEEVSAPVEEVSAPVEEVSGPPSDWVMEDSPFYSPSRQVLLRKCRENDIKVGRGKPMDELVWLLEEQARIRGGVTIQGGSVVHSDTTRVPAVFSITKALNYLRGVEFMWVCTKDTLEDIANGEETNKYTISQEDAALILGIYGSRSKAEILERLTGSIGVSEDHARKLIEGFSFEQATGAVVEFPPITKLLKDMGIIEWS